MNSYLYIRYPSNVVKTTVCHYYQYIVLVVILCGWIMLRKTPTQSIDIQFQSPITDDERELLMKTTRTFIRALESAGIPYMIYSGTLLGSYRHHDLIPWDDDIDVFINGSLKNVMRRFLPKYDDSFALYVPNFDNFAWKYYRKDMALKMLPGLPFGWPYVDIFFFNENETHIWDDNLYFTETFTFRKDKVFPLRRRPFSTMQLYAPCDPLHLLSMYNIDECSSCKISHKHETSIPVNLQRVVPCQALTDFYPFVHHTKTEDGWKETLKLGEIILDSIDMKKTC